jgi:hypothetical protein
MRHIAHMRDAEASLHTSSLATITEPQPDATPRGCGFFLENKCTL